MKTNRIAELIEEFRLVVTGRANLIDSIVPPVIFVIVNALLGFDYAMWSSLVIASLITVLRLRRRQPLWYAMGGFAGVAFAVLVSRLLGRAEGYFLPGIISGGLTVLVCLVSVMVGRPVVAWTSYIARRWPLEWYWHPKVRPAYSEVTWLWVIFFGLRLLVQFNLFREAAADVLAVVNVLTGWPATIILLAVSYLYGTWRLGNLGGPSVEEFKTGVKPPWESQRRGF